MSTDKIPSTTIDEWALALKWHPDLARDLRECRAVISTERRYKRLWAQARLVWGPLSATMWPGKPSTPMWDSQSLPVAMTAAWLHRRYKTLWDDAPRFPDGAFQDALHAAVEAGTWEAAIVIIRQAVSDEVEIQNRTDRAGHTFRVGWVYADVFDDVEQVQPPEWMARVRNNPQTQALLQAGAWPEDLPSYPSILLTTAPNGTLAQATKALEAAWEDIKPTLTPQLGTRPGKEARGRPPNFAQHVMHYRLWRQWPSRARRHGDKATQAAFAKALSKKALPIQQPRALALIRTRTAVLPYVIDWLIGDEAAASYSEKRLRETVLPLLSPNKDAGTLRSFLNGNQKNTH